MDKQVDKSHYFNQKYNHKARWLSYWYQIDLVLSTGAKSILEVGLGAGIVKKYLDSVVEEVKTLDIDSELNPDIIGSVEKMSIEDKRFDCILAAEVLEHIPYERFKDTLKEIARVSRKWAIISLPDSRRTICSWYWKIPFLSPIIVLWKINRREKHRFDGQHYWEIGKQEYSLERIKSDIINSGWKIIKSFTPQDVPTKHFFLLEK